MGKKKKIKKKSARFIKMLKILEALRNNGLSVRQTNIVKKVGEFNVIAEFNEWLNEALVEVSEQERQENQFQSNDGN